MKNKNRLLRDIGEGLLIGTIVSVFLIAAYTLWLDYRAQRDLEDYHQMLTSTQTAEYSDDEEVTAPTITENSIGYTDMILTAGDTRTFEFEPALTATEGSAVMSGKTLVTYEEGCAELVYGNQRIALYILADPREYLYSGEYITSWTIEAEQRMMDNNSAGTLRLYHDTEITYNDDKMIITNEYSGWFPTDSDNIYEACETLITETVEVKIPCVDDVDILESAPLLPKALVDDFYADGYICVVRPDIVSNNPDLEDDGTHRVLGYIDSTNKAVVLRRPYGPDSATLYHEMGHYLDSRYKNVYGTSASESQDFLSIYNEEKQNASSYAQTKSSEYFAENYANYLMTPFKFKESCPRTYAFFEETVNTVL